MEVSKLLQILLFILFIILIFRNISYIILGILHVQTKKEIGRFLCLLLPKIARQLLTFIFF